jgi:hypothetical protein
VKVVSRFSRDSSEAECNLRAISASGKTTLLDHVQGDDRETFAGSAMAVYSLALARVFAADEVKLDGVKCIGEGRKGQGR